MTDESQLNGYFFETNEKSQISLVTSEGKVPQKAEIVSMGH